MTVSRLASTAGIQLQGGYIPVKELDITPLCEKQGNYAYMMRKERPNRRIQPSVFGVVFGYMLDYEMTLESGQLVSPLSVSSYRIAHKGALKVGQLSEFDSCVARIDELYCHNPRDYNAIINEFRRIAIYDTIYRSGFYQLVNEIPMSLTDSDVKSMCRAVSATKEYLCKTAEEFNFEVGFTGVHSKNILPSDCDLVTDDSLIDFKCSTKEPNSKQTFQLLLYYLLGKHECPKMFNKVKYLKIINPLLGNVYTYDIKKLDTDYVKHILENKIGYPKKICDVICAKI